MPLPRRCSAPPSTGRSSPPRDSLTRGARTWAASFVHWYNVDHRHSGIRYVSPAQRHAGDDHAILAARHALYTHARERNPARWSRHTRNWSPIGAVTLNPERDSVVRLDNAEASEHGRKLHERGDNYVDARRSAPITECAYAGGLRPKHSGRARAIRASPARAQH